MAYNEYGTLHIERDGSVATVHMYNLTVGIVAGRKLDFHWEIAMALGERHFVPTEHSGDCAE